jgi:hypothetical protein
MRVWRGRREEELIKLAENLQKYNEFATGDAANFERAYQSTMSEGANTAAK